ncbi:hypothetical protein RCOM_1586690 [Ricinus communis]|uniref:Uncharacterized protein n=1 Tax=Ricinus communis TaxID=3988 RepID=B9R6X4_RICCO|nr:hypothetical protein RCOM_1586690 [Ricinus communis]
MDSLLLLLLEDDKNAFADGVLRILAAFEEFREKLVEENAVFVLIGLAAFGTALAQEIVIGCLCDLAKDDEKVIVDDESIIARLVAVLDFGVLGARIAAARAVYELASNTKQKRKWVKLE